MKSIVSSAVVAISILAIAPESTQAIQCNDRYAKVVSQSALSLLPIQMKAKTKGNNTAADNGSLIESNATFSHTLSQDNDTIAVDNISVIHLGDNSTLVEHDNSTLINLQSNSSSHAQSRW